MESVSSRKRVARKGRGRSSRPPSAKLYEFRITFEAKNLNEADILANTAYTALETNGGEYHRALLVGPNEVRRFVVPEKFLPSSK